MKPFSMSFSAPEAFFPKTPFNGKQLSEKGAILLNKTLEPSCRLVIESIIHVSERRKKKKPIGHNAVKMTSIGEEKLFASWAAGFCQQKEVAFNFCK